MQTPTRLSPVLLFVLVLLPWESLAQRFDFASFILENDFLFLQDQTDKYYTNGFRYERIGPRYDRRHKLVNKLLIIFPHETRDSNLSYYGAFFGQNIYTPLDITVPEVQTGDRPYSGWTYWGAKSISTNLTGNQRITTEISIGLLGPEALAGEVQTFVHKLIDSDIPQGWSHQVDSDLGINYMVKYEIGTRVRKQWPMMEAIAFGKSTVGTIFTNVNGGAFLSIGQMDNYFNIYTIGSNSIESLSKIYAANGSKNCLSWFIDGFTQYFLFARPHVRYDFYNAMLQGGLLNKTSEYTIDSENITRSFFQIDYGLAFSWYSLTAMYSQSIRTRELSFGPSMHCWGSVNIILTY